VVEMNVKVQLFLVAMLEKVKQRDQSIELEEVSQIYDRGAGTELGAE
jgi:hypothetical protein